MSITAAQRFTRSHPCRCCGGYDQAPRGHGVRCSGFLSEDGIWCRCSREELAGGLSLDTRTCPPTYVHHLTGSCKCGATHDGSVSPVSVEGMTSTRHQSRTGRKGDLGAFERYYVYADEHGRPRHRTLRFRDQDGEKTFCQQGYIDGEWVTGLKGVETVLYGLPRLLAAPASRNVFLTEGEKDCESLWAVGWLATTPPNGGWKRHYDQWLVGRPVVIVEDNDEAGRARSKRLNSQLQSVAESVRIMSFPDLPEGGDVTDWLAGGGTADELLAMIGAPYIGAIRA